MNDLFGKTLRALMDGAEVKERALAEALSYDTTYISKWLNGSKLPSPRNAESVIRQIAGFLVRQQGGDESREQELFHTLKTAYDRDSSYISLSRMDLVLYASVINHYLAEGTVSVGNVEHRLSTAQAQAHLQHLSRLMRENPDFDIWLIRDTTMLSDTVRRAPSLFIDTISVYIENARADAHGNFHISMDPRMRQAFQTSFERLLRQPYCTKLTPEDLLRYL